MALGKLSDLQERILVVLAGVSPPWTLTGGGALAGFHTKHRTTRDLDLFFHEHDKLGPEVGEVAQLLVADGCAVVTLQSSARFTQLDVRRGAETIVVDLVADPTPIIELAQPHPIGGATILVETPHQLLVNKLCALLGRSELRDLVDVRALLDAGESLERALVDCPKQDAGFSPLTFAWTVRSLAVARLATAIGWSAEQIEAVERFRDELVEHVVRVTHP